MEKHSFLKIKLKLRVTTTTCG